ncbi:MAG: glycosyltransferase [Pseudomonadota bacterium]
MKVAIVHYWLVGMRGGERVLEQMLQCYPDADIYTHVYDRSAVSDAIAARPVRESFVGRLPGAKRHYQKYLPLMPRALEELDLSAYDLVLSSESGPAKGVIAAPDATHICYCHSPMRYLYDHYPQYSAGMGRLQRLVFSHVAHRLRQWDLASAARVDRFIANSHFIARRIRRVYGRAADVVHPPVDLAAFGGGEAQPRQDFYLVVSQLVGYKRVDLAIEAVRGTDRRLIVAGKGEAMDALRASAPENVAFLGAVPRERLIELYATARALLFPGEEDFGIVPIEALASGCPVIALGRGGVLDTLQDGVTGTLFAEQSVPALQAAITRFEHGDYPAETLRRIADTYSEARFRTRFVDVVSRVMAENQERPAAGGLTAVPPAAPPRPDDPIAMA